MANCTAKIFGDAIENHKKSHIIEIKCHDKIEKKTINLSIHTMSGPGEFSCVELN